jgi:hypothetical protein
VTVKPEPATGRATGGATVDARSWPGGICRRRTGEPTLDVERVMNDSWRASGRFHRVDLELDADGAGYTVDVTFRRAQRSAPDGRTGCVHQPSGSTPITGNEELRTASHQPVCFKTGRSCS